MRISKKRRFQTYYEFINIVFTSVEIEGQIYIPAVKWLLLAGCLILVIVFKTSSSLAAAYGIAVWVGIIAFAGLDAETGVVMLLYLDLAHEKWRKEGKLNSLQDLKESVMFGAVKRIRPKMMTVSVILAGLIPIMFSHGTGADVMKRIAAPMVGGVVTSAILELVIYPAIYMIWRGRELKTKG